MKKLLLFSIPLLFMACGSPSENQSNEALLQSMMDSSNVASVGDKIPEEAVGEILKQIPSPIETSVLIKKSGGSYSKEILNPSENAQNYSSNYKRALNLGVYGADLGYINIYEKNKESLYYLNSIKSMADGLNIGQFFDFETIKRLASNNKNADSLLNITTDNFNKINSFLYEQKRSDQSVLILTGGWLESLNIMCKIAQKNKNPKIYERIGEQKIIVDQLVLVLTNYSADPNIKLLNEDLKQLQKIFEKVQITYTYKESKMEIVDGIPTIVDKSESKVNITEAQVIEVANLANSIRNKIVS
ncbi:MAG TPA: hypothetical protein VK766_12170 [Cytophagaceae bacterium]|jgi:hypothetical protein|nr:hypothetical protein [Cytophagaceae bacterium]